jgi:hypothetical protein
MSRKELAELLNSYRNSENIELVNYTELGEGNKCISLRAEGSFGFPNGSQCVHAIGLDMQKISVAFVLKTQKK